MSPRRLVPLMLLLGCPSADEDDVRDDTDASDTDDTQPTDSDTDTAPPPVDPSDPTYWGGTFTDVSAPLRGAAGFPVGTGSIDPWDEPQTTTAFFADLDEDGTPEVVTSSSRFGLAGDVAHRVWRYDGGTLAVDPELTDALDDLDTAWRGAIDLDGDGHLDLLGGMHNALVAWGLGDETFAPPLFVPLVVPVGELESVGVWDVDHDGLLDLLLPDGRCEQNLRILRQVRPRGFVSWPEALPDQGPAGLSDTLGVYPTEQGLDTLVLSAPAECLDTEAHPGFYVDDGGVYAPADLTDDEAWWKLDPSTPGLPFTSRMPMGSVTTDLDDDGTLDLLLSLDVVSWLRGPPPFDDATGTAGLRRQRAGGAIWFPWGSQALDLDRDGRKDVVTAIGDDATSFNLLQGLDIHNQVLWHAPDHTFSWIEDTLGLDAIGSWHGVTVADLDGDLDPDLVFAGYGTPSRVYRNDTAPPGNGMVLDLVGTTSNVAAFGARITVETATLPTQHHVVGGEANPAGLSHQPVFVGLGPDDEADLTIRWPSGYTQRVEGLAAGARHRIVEPTLIALSEDDRTLPADGSSVLTVSVYPRDLQGDVLVEADAILTWTGDGTVLGPATWVDDHWALEVRAPATPGEGRITVELGDTVLRVAPRVWFTATSAR